MGITGLCGSSIQSVCIQFTKYLAEIQIFIKLVINHIIFKGIQDVYPGVMPLASCQFIG